MERTRSNKRVMGIASQVSMPIHPGGGAVDVFGCLGWMSLSEGVLGVDPHALEHGRTCVPSVHIVYVLILG